jgi:hypothetical protein
MWAASFALSSLLRGVASIVVYRRQHTREVLQTVRLQWSTIEMQNQGLDSAAKMMSRQRHTRSLTSRLPIHGFVIYCTVPVPQILSRFTAPQDRPVQYFYIFDSLSCSKSHHLLCNIYRILVLPHRPIEFPSCQRFPIRSSLPLQPPHNRLLHQSFRF